VDTNSPQFRGPRGDGVAYGNNLPVAWSTTSNVVWSCAILGKGWSSPVVWGDRVFVTSTVSPGSVEAPKELGSVMEHIRGQTTTDEHQYMLHCVDWQTGRLVWSRCAHKGVPPGSIHPKNSYASETPVTDGERVYAYFGNVGLFCYDLDGRELWSRRWGSFRMDWNWGTSASPALHGDLLIVLNDNQEKSFLVALDKRTGRDVWRVERDEKSNWSTPFIWQNDLRTEIVTSGSGKVRSYDLSGTLLWELRGMSGVTVPTPFAADGLLYIASGCAHSALRPVYAIRPGATGDISLQDGATANAHIAWCQRRAAPYVTSPLVCDGLLYVLLDKGTLAAYDARTGEEFYSKQRFTDGRAAFSASPWAYDGKIFCLAETGETYVVAAGPEFRVLHVNRLDESTLATPAIARDSLIVRTLTKLYRIANPPAGSSAAPHPQARPVENVSDPSATTDGSKRTAITEPPVPRNESATTPLARLVFTQDYFSGTRDANGQFMGGTEAMWLAGHDGRLFAAIGYGQDRPGTDPKPGAQVLRKDTPDVPWQVDYGFGPDCMRVEGLISFAFTTDLHSRPLTGPVSLLIASPSELTRTGGTSAVFVRNDTTGQWQRSDITGGNLGVRSFGSHVDKVTGVHHLLAGLNRGGIHRGSYDPAAPGGIRWEPLPERTAEALPGKGRRVYDYSRVLCFAECNGDLYVAARIATDTADRPVDGGLYRRVDGPKSSWELVYRWAIDKEVLQSRFLRGLTAVPDPHGGTREVLIANFEYPGTIARFDPSCVGTNGFIAAEQELDIKEFFNQAWNTPTASRRGAIAAYNRFLPVTDPRLGEPLWLCGAWVERPGSPNPPNNGSCYLIRHRDGCHDWAYIYDAAHPVPVGERLTGCRDIEPSPLPGEQGRVFYFCGYDGGAGPSHNTAWIYRGQLSETELPRNKP
jgi:outer membrane protein assembly factor BamB